MTRTASLSFVLLGSAEGDAGGGHGQAGQRPRLRSRGPFGGRYRGRADAPRWSSCDLLRLWCRYRYVGAPESCGQTHDCGAERRDRIQAGSGVGAIPKFVDASDACDRDRCFARQRRSKRVGRGQSGRPTPRLSRRGSATRRESAPGRLGSLQPIARTQARLRQGVHDQRAASEGADRRDPRACLFEARHCRNIDGHLHRGVRGTPLGVQPAEGKQSREHASRPSERTCTPQREGYRRFGCP